MIRMFFGGVKWGVDPVEESDGGAPGMQINLLDEQSGIFVHVPFTGESLGALVEQLSDGLTEDQRRALASKLTSGIHLPGKDFDPTKIIEPGEQS